jgi:hypothetical protein
MSSNEEIISWRQVGKEFNEQSMPEDSVFIEHERRRNKG